MNQLLLTQEKFLACLQDDDAPLPAGFDARRAAGMDVYRNAYRARLIEVLRSTFERTVNLVGDEAFAQAAAHHLILHPPGSWTIDLVGQRFAKTCADLFAQDPDVGELAWLEWTMHCAFTAADTAPITRASFAAATAGFDAGQWDSLCLALMPGTALRPVTFDIPALWRALGDPAGAQPVLLEEAHWLLVWRDDELPVFALVPCAEGQALADMQGGTPFGQACADALHGTDAAEAVARAGAMLQGWIDMGLIEGVRAKQQASS